MASYSTSAEITVAQYTDAEFPEKMIEAVEERVRGTLAGASEEQALETTVGWLAVVPGRDEETAGPGQGRAARFIAWTPGTTIPQGAQTLICRGRRLG
jgi:hypothetical protein